VAGTNPDVAQMQVQNKVQQALTRLPQVVQSQGVTVTKSGTDFLLIANFVSDDPNHRVRPGRLCLHQPGGHAQPHRRRGRRDDAGLGLRHAHLAGPGQDAEVRADASDISSALESQNTQVSAGQLGALPAVPGQQINAVVSARSKLRTVEQFQNVVVKSATDGALVHLGDVARVELGSDSYTFQTRYNGRPAAGVGIKLASGANALGVAKAVKAKLAELAPFFPNQIHYASATTPRPSSPSRSKRWSRPWSRPWCWW
jgi:HAE1 family hydrophobic/amphiphilic exporter-1/multidrug efflux pump